MLVFIQWLAQSLLVFIDNEDLPLGLGAVKQPLIITCLIFCSQNSQTKRGKEACYSVPFIPAFANSDACLFFPPVNSGTVIMLQALSVSMEVFYSSPLM